MNLQRFSQLSRDEIINSFCFSPDVDKEYRRFIHEIGDEDPYCNRISIGIHDVLRAHFLIVDFFLEDGEGIGGIGPRSVDLLHSALGRQYTGFGGIQKWTDKYELCATLLYGLIKNHPFYDANKRTAFLSTLYMLHKNGRCPTVSKKQFEDFTVDLAEDRFAAKKRFRGFQKKGDDPEIRYVAHFLRKNTRDIDKRNYFITYRELKTILNNFDYDLTNPNGNYIDIVKCEKATNLLERILSGKKTKQTKVAQIGFPGWTKQVNKGAITTVRRSTQLTHEYGYDSQTFFNGLDDMRSLLNLYQDALRGLAYR